MSGYTYDRDGLESEIKQSIIKDKKRQTPTIEDRLLCKITPIIDNGSILVMDKTDYRRYMEGKNER